MIEANIKLVQQVLLSLFPGDLVKNHKFKQRVLLVV